MKNFASSTGIGVALSATAMSVVWALFVPYGYPWPSLAWVVLACAVAVWVAKSSILPNPQMSDVISGVEAEPAQALARPDGAATPAPKTVR